MTQHDDNDGMHEAMREQADRIALEQISSDYATLNLHAEAHQADKQMDLEIMRSRAYQLASGLGLVKPQGLGLKRGTWVVAGNMSNSLVGEALLCSIVDDDGFVRFNVRRIPDLTCDRLGQRESTPSGSI